MENVCFEVKIGVGNAYFSNLEIQIYWQERNSIFEEKNDCRQKCLDKCLVMLNKVLLYYLNFFKKGDYLLSKILSTVLLQKKIKNLKTKCNISIYNQCFQSCIVGLDLTILGEVCPQARNRTLPWTPQDSKLFFVLSS